MVKNSKYAITQDPSEIYPSSVSGELWTKIEYLFDSQSKKGEHGGRPAHHKSMAIFNAILYKIALDCSWRMLPHDFPNWQTVRTNMNAWARSGKLTRAFIVLDRLKLTVHISESVNLKYLIYCNNKCRKLPPHLHLKIQSGT
jgi:transposase